MAESGLSALGITVWQAKTTEKAKVTEASAYTQLTRINEIGEISVTPEAIESSALEDYEAQFVPGRSTVTDSLPITVNVTNDTIAEWEAIAGETICVLVDVPGLNKQWFVIVTVPRILPFSGATQNSLVTAVVNCTVNTYIGLSERVEVKMVGTQNETE